MAKRRTTRPAKQTKRRTPARPMPTTSKLYVVEDDDNMNLAEFLSCYGYLLKQPGGWRWLTGLLADDQLQHARAVIEARYGTATPPALAVVPKSQPRRNHRKAA